jgi:hypothetical protein
MIKGFKFGRSLCSAFLLKDLKVSSKYYFVSSFSHTWFLGLMTRQLGGPQQVIMVEVQALLSDSCVDV